MRNELLKSQRDSNRLGERTYLDELDKTAIERPDTKPVNNVHKSDKEQDLESFTNRVTTNWLGKMNSDRFEETKGPSLQDLERATTELVIP